MLPETATENDLHGILDILNHYIRCHHCTFDTKPWAVDEKLSWFGTFSADGPYQLRLTRSGNTVTGYAHSARWRPKAAYDVTAETTVYVHPDFQGQGLGTLLLRDLLGRLEATPLEQAVAGIAQPNEASNRLHRQLGFHEVGTYRRVGYKFDRRWDVTWFQRNLAQAAQQAHDG